MMTATDRRSAPRAAPPQQHKPEDYHGVQAWGRQLGSFAAYRYQQQQLAAQEGAPLDAIYKAEDGVWHTVNDISNQAVKDIIEADIEHLKKIHGKA